MKCTKLPRRGLAPTPSLCQNVKPAYAFLWKMEIEGVGVSILRTGACFDAKSHRFDKQN